MKSIIPIPLSQYDGKIEYQPEDEVWVRGADSPANVARKYIVSLQERGRVVVATFGARAVNQAVNAVAIARQMWRDSEMGEELNMVPYFSTVIDANGNDRTRMMLMVYPIRDDDVTRLLHREETQ